MRIPSGLVSLLVLTASFTACGDGGAAVEGGHARLRVVLPVGDATAGRQAFTDLWCHACHRVSGDPDLPETIAVETGPDLGAEHAAWSGSELATAIIAPSHEISSEVRERLEDGMSPMGDYSHAMTVRQLVDLVAWLQSP